MNIYDISKKAGVSIATVSRVLNESSHVSEKTRDKVLAVIKAENYSPSGASRSLSIPRTVGILYSDASDLYLANAIYHLERELRKNGYASLICCCGYETDRRKKQLSMMLSKKVDAIILAGSHFVEEYDEDNDYIRQAAKEVPIGILSGKLNDEHIVSAYCDDRQAIYDTASRLFDLGSKQIVFLCGAISYSIRQKITGLQEAYAARDIPFRDKYVIYCPLSNFDLCAEYLRAVRHQFFYDAVICADDAFAVSALKYAEKESIRVPDQLRIVGYNDSILSRCTSPELSTVDNRTHELCVKLVEMVINSITGQEEESQFFLPGNLIFRGTT